jgi:hypothetical protein
MLDRLLTLADRQGRLDLLWQIPFAIVATAVGMTLMVVAWFAAFACLVFVVTVLGEVLKAVF